MFLERVFEGKNEIGRWIAMLVLVLVVSQLAGVIPLQVVKFLKVTDNPDLDPNPEDYLDFASYDITPSAGLGLMLIPFILGLGALFLFIKPVHNRPMSSLINGESGFRWKKFLWGAAVWLVLMTVYSVFAVITGMQKVEFQFNPDTFAALVLVSVLLLPFQAGFEEVLFRGYLMQGFAKVFQYKWLALVITSLIFGGLHFWNPEVREYGAVVVMPQYIWFGIFLGICTLMEDGIEMAWGVHAMNNLFLSLFFTQDSSALQTPALWRITAFNPVYDLLALFVLSVLFLFITHRKYQWPHWRLILAKINKPESIPEEDFNAGYPESEYDEYNEE